MNANLIFSIEKRPVNVTRIKQISKHDRYQRSTNTDLHIELNPMNPLVSFRSSCYMGVMLGFPVRAHYP